MTAGATTTRPPSQASDQGSGAESAAVRHLRAGGQLAAAGMTALGIGTIVAWVLGLAFPLLFFFVAAVAWLIPPAAAAGAVTAGAALAVCRSLGCGARLERVVVLASSIVLPIPALFAVSVLSSGRALAVWWLWVAVTALAAVAGYRSVLRNPLDAWRPVIVRCLLGVAIGVGSVGVMFTVFAGFGASFHEGGGGSGAWLAPTVLLATAGMLGLVGILISLGPFRTRTSAALTWAGVGMLVASIVAVMLGVMLQSAREEIALGPSIPGGSETAEQWTNPATGYAGESSREEVPYPTLDEARAEFASLAAAIVEAAGPDAIWRDDPAAMVEELECRGGGTMLRIDGEFAMGIVTDTTTDEHDREVTEANLAAADRIVRAWSELGLGTPEVIHGEPLLGGAELASVDLAEVDFAFGVAQPRVEGRCLPPR